MAWLEVESGTYAGSGSTIRCKQGPALTPTGGAITVTDSFHNVAAGTLSTINGGVANSLYVLLATGTITLSAPTNISTASTSLPAGQALVLWFDGTTFTDLGSTGVRLTGNQTVAGNKTFTNGIFERGRSVAAGTWTSFTPAVTPSSGSWSAPTYTTAKYMLIGKTAWVIVAMSGTLSSNATLAITIPGGLAANMICDGVARNTATSAQTLVQVTAIGGTNISLYASLAGAAFTAGAIDVRFQIVFEVQ